MSASGAIDETASPTVEIPRISLLVRRVHMFAGLFLAPWMLMYAFSTLVMTHQEFVASFYPSKDPVNRTRIGLLPFLPNQPHSRADRLANSSGSRFGWYARITWRQKRKTFGDSSPACTGAAARNFRSSEKQNPGRTRTVPHFELP